MCCKRWSKYMKIEIRYLIFLNPILMDNEWMRNSFWIVEKILWTKELQAWIKRMNLNQGKSFSLPCKFFVVEVSNQTRWRQTTWHKLDTLVSISCEKVGPSYQLGSHRCTHALPMLPQDVLCRKFVSPTPNIDAKLCLMATLHKWELERPRFERIF